MNPAGFLDFCWSDAAGAGLSRYNLAIGEEGNFLRNFFTPDLPVSVRNGISFTGVGALSACPALSRIAQRYTPYRSTGIIRSLTEPSMVGLSSRLNSTPKK